MMRSHSRKAPLVGVAALAALIPASQCRAADDQVRQSLDVVYESRSSGNTDVDRFQVTSGYEWSTGRRESLSLTVPWQSVDTTSNGVSSSASGLKDASLNFDFAVREQAQGESTHWQLRLNLPIGKDSLGQQEFQAVQNLNNSASGFLAPQFGRGFSGGIRRYWSRKRGNAEMNWYVGYQEETGYTVASFTGTILENSGIDQYTAGVSRKWDRGRLGFKVGLDVVAFDTGISTNNGVGSRIESDPNYILTTQVTQRHTDRYSSSYLLTYQVRDKQDTFSPGVLINPRNTELGNRLFWSWLLKRQDPGNSYWELGFKGLTTEHSVNGPTNASPGPIAGSAKDELYSQIGYGRSLANGGSWNLSTQIGLTGDSRDLVVRGGYQRKF